MILLFFLIGIQLEMPPLYWLIWIIVFIWKICDS